MTKRTYTAPKIERVPLVAEEAVLSACKVGTFQFGGPPNGWCSGIYNESCAAVGS